MNKLLAIIMLAAAATARADTNTVESASLETIIQQSGWTARELLDALDLLEAKYWRDVSTASGRTAWHGRKVGESVDTNTLTKVSTYEDGMTFTDEAKITTPAESARKANAALSTNGVPARLANARARAARGVTTNTVTVSIGAGK